MVDYLSKAVHAYIMMKYFYWSLWTGFLISVACCNLSYYLPTAAGRTDGFLYFSRAFVLSEVQTDSFRIWTERPIPFPFHIICSNSLLYPSIKQRRYECRDRKCNLYSSLIKNTSETLLILCRKCFFFAKVSWKVHRLTSYLLSFLTSEMQTL